MKLFVVLLLAVGASAEIVSTVNQKFKTQTNTDLKDQIVRELQAGYFYDAYSHYFARADVALYGFAKFFAAAAKEERTHAEKMMEYINKRGGEVELGDIKLQDVCLAVSQLLQASTLTTEKSAACICYFMSRDVENVDAQCGLRKDWFSGLMAMEDTLMLERYVNQQLLDIHERNDGDPHFSHTMEHEFLDEQVDSIKKIGDMVTQLRRAGKDLGEYIFDEKLNA
ncbi:hypothetical protein FSP39_020122 [Pinctada imbricata]|uniref:Ferritin n=1 Tax=Pinctada imbricata TaxID=66713 RepID=A0AA89BU11_PINIB|nr:hypothetical protein FSP39_020122 [Pinctada imbricata]